MDWSQVAVAAVAGGVFSGVAYAILAAPKAPAKYRANLVVAVAVAGSVGATTFARTTHLTDRLNLRLGLKTPLEIEGDRMGREMQNDPQLRALLKGRSESEARQIAAELARKGIPLLDPEQLLVWARLNAKMAAVSPAFCAARWKSGVPAALFEEAFGKLTPAERTEWGNMTVQAVRLAARDNSNVTPPPPDALGEGIKAIFTKLGPQEGARAAQDAARADLSDARACELFKLTINGGQELPVGERDPFLRSFAQL